MAHATHGDTEALVVGWTVAGAIAALHLAQSGRPVLVLDPPATRSTSPHTDNAPLPRRLAEGRVPAGAPVRHILRHLGLSLEAGEAPDSRFQVVLPEGRVELGNGAASDHAELSREFPAGLSTLDAVERIGDDLDTWLSAWADRPTPSSGSSTSHPARWSSFQQQLHQLLGSAPQPVLRLLTAPTAALPMAPQAAAADLRSAVRFWWRLRRPQGPLVETLLDHLWERYRAAGGERITPEGDLRIANRWGRPAVLRHDDTERCFKRLVWALAPGLLPSHLASARLAKRLRTQWATDTPPTCVRRLLHVSLPAEAVPEPMAQSLFLGDWDPPHQRHALWIRCDRSRHQGRPTLLTIHSAGSPEALVSGAGRFRSACLERLRSLLPFLDDHLAWTLCPHGNEPAQGPSPQGAPRIAAYPPDPLYEPPPGSPLGFDAIPLVPGPARLIAASQATYPGLGLEGEILAGWHAAQLITG